MCACESPLLDSWPQSSIWRVRSDPRVSEIPLYILAPPSAQGPLPGNSTPPTDLQAGVGPSKGKNCC